MPDFFEIALPAAILGGILLALNRMKTDNELDVMHSLGLGLHNLLPSIMLLALLVMLVEAVLIGFLQPYGQYQFRLLRHTVLQNSLDSLLRSESFIQIDDTTFFAEPGDANGADGSKLFVFEMKNNGQIAATAEGATFYLSDENGKLFLDANNGRSIEVRADSAQPHFVSFNNARWYLRSLERSPFRSRGGSVHELTIPELWAASRVGLNGIPEAEIRAKLHSQIATIVYLPILPLIAVSLAVGNTARVRAIGFFSAIFVLVVFIEALNFGKNMATREIVSPWVGVWGTVIVFAILGTCLFLYANSGFRRRADRLQAARIHDSRESSV
jgi:lipopolysaccharide export system permease protein